MIMLPLIMGGVKDTPGSLFRADLRECRVIHRLCPQVDLVCGERGDMPCVRAMLDFDARLLPLVMALLDAPAEQVQ